MIISKIKQIAKTNRYHLYADEVWQGVFLDEILAVYKLKTNQEIDEEVFAEIKKENDKKLSFDMAVSYLEKYTVSEKGLRDYLKKRGFLPKAIDSTIEKLKEYNFLNDEKFAKNYFDSFSSRMGKKAIASKLLQKGVSKDIVDSLLEEVDEDSQFENALLLAKKFVKNRDFSLKTKQKCLAHLIYKGYDYSVAQQAINQIFSNKGEDNESWV
ncbi:MAG: hypothetical protein E7375_02440 [Clostridiales bacterium]|nr:hypothetical protein [Clostridiales bacterium]